MVQCCMLASLYDQDRRSTRPGGIKSWLVEDISHVITIIPAGRLFLACY